MRVRVGGVDALVRETAGCGSSVVSARVIVCSNYLSTCLPTYPPTHLPTYPPAYHLPAALPTYQAKLAKMGFMLQQRPVPLDNIYTAAQAQVAYLVSAAPHQPPEPKPDPFF